MKLSELILWVIGVVLTGVILYCYFTGEPIEILLSCVSYMTIIFVSFFISLFFNKISTFIRVFIGVGVFILLTSLYVIFQNQNYNSVKYINSTLFIVFVLLMILACRSSPKLENNKESKDRIYDDWSPLDLILSGRINNRFDLLMFYDKHNNRHIAFSSFLNELYDSAILNKDLNKENLDQIKKLIVPILKIVYSQEKYDKLNSKERDFIQKIHSIVENDNSSNKERIYDNLNSLAEVLYDNQNRMQNEIKRNNQALVVSWFGIIVTIILSVLSILITIGIIPLGRTA